MLASLWRRKASIIAFAVALVALFLAPAPVWLKIVGIAAATLVYWWYAWKHQGIREQTLEALERERERHRRPPSR
jgi:membrane protein implicated in regulation of membrane protease activity